MAPYVGKTNKYRMHKFRDSDFPHTFMKVTWSINEYTKVEQNADSKVGKGGVKVQGLYVSPNEILDIIHEKQFLENEKEAIDKHLDQLFFAKREMEIKYRGIRSKR